MAFNGRVESDFLKLAQFDALAKPEIIDYAATDFDSLRRALIAYIQAAYPLDYQNFIESDLGVMLIELVAYMGAVMSMKADMLANENYLSTARNRINVGKILELLGIKLKGPISSACNAKITLDSSGVGGLTIPIGSRVVTINSPEDGNPVTFTLYKTSNGQISDATSDGSISLENSESNGALGLVWENLVLLEGALVSEAGTVETTDVSKTIVLNASPVVEKSVSIFLTPPNSTGQAWNEIDSLFFTSGSTDQVFEVIKTENYGATLLFGDGISGKPVATNTDYFITYRVGGGSRGNILSDVINVPISGEDDDSNAKSGILENTSVAVGGRDAEDVEKAKRYAPLVFRSQNRLVTINDYSNFANQYANSVGATGKARAIVRDAYSSANIIDIYLLQVASNIQLQQATVEYKKQLLEAIQDKKMITDEVVIVDGVVRTLDLVMTVRIDKYLLPREEQIKAKVRDRLLRFFNVDNFDFGKPLNISELNRAVFTLPEVRYATVDNLDSDVVVDFNEIIQLNNFTINIVGV
jgi:hypothetical protein